MTMPRMDKVLELFLADLFWQPMVKMPFWQEFTGDEPMHSLISLVRGVLAETDKPALAENRTVGNNSNIAREYEKALAVFLRGKLEVRAIEEPRFAAVATAFTRLREVLALGGEPLTLGEQLWRQKMTELAASRMDLLMEKLWVLGQLPDVSPVQAAWHIQRILLTLSWDNIAEISDKLTRMLEAAQRLEMRGKLKTKTMAWPCLADMADEQPPQPGQATQSKPLEEDGGQESAVVQNEAAPDRPAQNANDIFWIMPPGFTDGVSVTTEHAAQLQTLEQMIRNFQRPSPLPRGLVITGAPGTGKTRLCQALAHKIARDPAGTDASGERRIAAAIVDARSFASSREVLAFVRDRLLFALHTFFPRRQFICPACKREYTEDAVRNMFRNKSEGEDLFCPMCDKAIPRALFSPYLCGNYQGKAQAMLDGERNLAAGCWEALAYLCEELRKQNLRLLIIFDHLTPAETPVILETLAALALALQSPLGALHFGLVLPENPNNPELAELVRYSCQEVTMSALPVTAVPSLAEISGQENLSPSLLSEYPCLTEVGREVKSQGGHLEGKNLAELFEHAAFQMSKADWINVYADEIERLATHNWQFHSHMKTELAQILQQKGWVYATAQGHLALTSLWLGNFLRRVVASGKSLHFAQWIEQPWFVQFASSELSLALESLAPGIVFGIAQSAGGQEQNRLLASCSQLYLTFFAKSLPDKAPPMLLDRLQAQMASFLESRPGGQDKNDARLFHETTALWCSLFKKDKDKVAELAQQWRLWQKLQQLSCYCLQESVAWVFPKVMTRWDFLDRHLFVAGLSPDSLNAVAQFCKAKPAGFFQEIGLAIALLACSETIPLSLGKLSDNGLRPASSPLSINADPIWPELVSSHGDVQTLNFLPRQQYKARREALDNLSSAFLNQTYLQNVARQLQQVRDKVLGRAQEPMETAVTLPMLLRILTALTNSEFVFCPDQQQFRVQLESLARYWLTCRPPVDKIETFLAEILPWESPESQEFWRKIFQDFLAKSLFGKLLARTLAEDNEFWSNLEQNIRDIRFPGDLLLLLRWTSSQKKRIQEALFRFWEENVEARNIGFARLLTHRWENSQALLLQFKKRGWLNDAMFTTFPQMDWWKKLAVSQASYRFLAFSLPQKNDLPPEQSQRFYLEIYSYLALSLPSAKREKLLDFVLSQFTPTPQELYPIWLGKPFTLETAKTLVAELLEKLTRPGSHAWYVLAGILHSFPHNSELAATVLQFLQGQAHFAEEILDIVSQTGFVRPDELGGFLVESGRWQKMTWPALLILLESDKLPDNLEILLLHAFCPRVGDLVLPENDSNQRPGTQTIWHIDRAALLALCVLWQKSCQTNTDRNREKMAKIGKFLRKIYRELVIYSGDATMASLLPLFADDDEIERVKEKLPDFRSENQLPGVKGKDKLPAFNENFSGLAEQFTQIGRQELATKTGLDLWYQLHSATYRIWQGCLQRQEWEAYLAGLPETKRALLAVKK